MNTDIKSTEEALDVLASAQQRLYDESVRNTFHTAIDLGFNEKTALVLAHLNEFTPERIIAVILLSQLDEQSPALSFLAHGLSIEGKESA